MDKMPPAQNAGSDTESDSFEARTREAMAASRQTSSPKRPRTGNTSTVPSGIPPVIPDNNLSFLNEELDKGVNRNDYRWHFRERGFCPVVSVNFQELKNDPKINLDLTSILGRYEGWLSRTDEYSPDVVRRFYCNLDYRTGTETELVTRLRGREIVLTPEILDRLLGGQPSDPLAPMTYIEAQRILMQGDFSGVSKFAPGRMCDFYRIIHFIFSRSMLCKSSSFTIFSQEECILLARIIRGDKLHLGELVFDALRKFRDDRWHFGDLPFPQIISFILKKFKIAHLEGDVKKVKAFGTEQLNRMHISLPLDPRSGMMPQSRKDKGKKAVGSSEAPEPEQENPQQPQEGGQSPASASTQIPSFSESSLRAIISEEFERMTEQLRTEIRAELDQRMDALRADMETIKDIFLQYVQGKYSMTEEDLGAPSEPPSDQIPAPSSDPQPEPIPESQPPISEPVIPEPSSEPTPIPPSPAPYDDSHVD